MVTKGYSQSSTVGVLFGSGDLFLSTDNINTSVINSRNPYAPWGIYTTGQLNIINNASEIEDLAKTVDNNGGVTFISALSGLGAPYWNPNATGAIMGITRGTKKGHIARAALEAIALRSREIIIEMQKDSGRTFNNLKVDGGASNNNLLMQIQSNLLQANVIRPKITETTALGVAFFAGLASGFWESIDEIKSVWEVEKQFSPQKNKNDLLVISNWEERIKKVL